MTFIILLIFAGLFMKVKKKSGNNPAHWPTETLWDLSYLVQLGKICSDIFAMLSISFVRQMKHG